jgi:hypothetical protein
MAAVKPEVVFCQRGSCSDFVSNAKIWFSDVTSSTEMNITMPDTKDGLFSYSVRG